jgi:hypothetical protein
MAFGKFAIDYKQRINFDRLRKERLKKTQKQLTEDSYYYSLSI